MVQLLFLFAALLPSVRARMMRGARRRVKHRRRRPPGERLVQVHGIAIGHGLRLGNGLAQAEQLAQKAVAAKIGQDYKTST
ncbi:hypothetical protein [Pseudomonas sp. FP2294]|uniref:hypothetical protein n=1 Tax=unclassified Pseudomonas TaxID=196821 RepID=UPI00273774C3|nr:hypothetical protein [Pseudomonas sp. FP2294]WLH55712.1 hypothetical protein PSH73_17550 [Pseudomonas sp. FP2294]